MFVHGKYFYGNEISEYGQEHGYVDYRTLAKSFDAVMNNSIIENTLEIGYWEQESGMVDNTEEIEALQEEIEELEDEITELENLFEQYEDDAEADLTNESEIMENLLSKVKELQEQIEELEEEQDSTDEIFQYFIVSDNGAEMLKEINEIVFYNEELDMYVWGVTHWGTSWDYVLTDIKCNVPYEDE